MGKSFNLNDSMSKVLLTMRLKGRAADRVHSRANNVTMSGDGMLAELKGMFLHRRSRIVMKSRFEDSSSLFSDFVYEKVILANAVPIADQEELLEYVIEGIFVSVKIKQTYVQRFRLLDTLTQAFYKCGKKG